MLQTSIEPCIVQMHAVLYGALDLAKTFAIYYFPKVARQCSFESLFPDQQLSNTFAVLERMSCVKRDALKACSFTKI